VSTSRIDPAGAGRQPSRLTLLACAVSGRSVDVAPTDPGDPPWTDGATVFIDPHAGPDTQLATLALQCSLLAGGSLDDDDVLRALRRSSAVTRRYLAVEGQRALAAHEHLLPTAARRHIDGGVTGRSDSPHRSIAIATGDGPVDEPPARFGAIRPDRMKRPDTPGGAGDAGAQHQPRRLGERALLELDDDDDDGGSTLDLLSSPVGGGGAIGRLLKKLLGVGRSAGDGPPGADAPTHVRRTPPRRGTTWISTAPAGLPAEATLGGRGARRYPEWDAGQGRYRLEWCTVAEVTPAPRELAPFAPVGADALRRPLARLGRDLERHRRQLQGDDLDIDAAVEARVAALAGSAPDEGVYLDALRRRRDLAVLVLLDVSGSSGEPSTSGRSVHELQRSAAGAIVSALDALGDRTSLYAFRSQGRTAVQLVRVKRFDDVFDALVLQRLGGLVPGAYTRLGAAIRHGTAVLEQEAGTSRRLLLVLSDGFAYDHGYEPAYGEADARRALAEARRRGIGSVCLSLGAGTDADALRRVFGTAAHGAVARPDQLPRVLGPLLRAALRSAELQRTASQRRTRTKERHAVERQAR
jgi:hypothetical protein